MELKHDGLDNEGFGNQGWEDSYLGTNIFCERVGGSVMRIPFDNPLLCGRLRWLLLCSGLFMGGNTGSTNAKMTSKYGYRSFLMMRYLEFLILFMYMLVF